MRHVNDIGIALSYCFVGRIFFALNGKFVLIQPFFIECFYTLWMRSNTVETDRGLFT